MDSSTSYTESHTEDYPNLSNSNNDYELIFDYYPLATFEVTQNGRITKFNSAAKSIFPSIQDKTTGIYFKHLFPKEIEGKLLQLLEQLELDSEKRSSLNSTIKIPLDDSDYKTFRFLFSPINKAKVDAKKYIMLIEDVSDYEEEKQYLRKHFEELQIVRDDLEERTSDLAILNEKLRQSEIQLEEINKNKDRFFSIISHDLRSPFNSLLGLTKLILEDFDGFSKEEIRDSVYNLHQVSEGLFNLIEDLLDWSRIQFNRIEFQAETFNLYEQVLFVVNSLKSVARDKNISIVNLVPKNCTIRADQHMVNTIIRNLVGNAIKFTPKYGLVKISSGFDIEDIIISVEDTGVGMRKEIADKLFKMESKVSTAGTEGEAGTGLGLLICKEFVEKHGGTIWVKSQVEKGSSFFFRLPIYQDD